MNEFIEEHLCSFVGELSLLSIQLFNGQHATTDAFYHFVSDFSSHYFDRCFTYAKNLDISKILREELPVP